MTRRLVIEVDGSQHGLEANQRHDEIRTRWLEAEGYRVILFWNNDVIRRTAAVIEAINDALGVTPPRPPSAGDPPPQGEGKSLRGE